MQEKIKVVYSWIGPRGPLWNTELPNVLSFSSVAENSQVNSPFWWTDDLWNRLFSKRKEAFELYPSFAIEAEVRNKEGEVIVEPDNRPFIFPYSLTWRVEFNNYFNGRTGIFEFSHIGWHLLPLIRNRNGYILIDHSPEAFMGDGHLNAMHGYFGPIHGIPLHKVIYLTGCVNANELYEAYCRRNNIPNNKNSRLTIISYPSSHQVFSTQLALGSIEPEYNTEILPDKLFLVWNRRLRKHRLQLALCLEKNNVVDRSYISFAKDDPENPTYSVLGALDTYKNNTNLQLNNEIVERFKQRLPLVLDGQDNTNKMCEDSNNDGEWNATRRFYQNSLISIITETNFDLPELTLTEKSFKPIKEKHPFIILGVPGALKAMREMGFKTFSEFWDESYDTQESPEVRMMQVSFITEQISKWTPEQILDFKRRVKPILEHNYNQLKIPSSKMIIDKIINHVQENFVS